MRPRNIWIATRFGALFGLAVACASAGPPAGVRAQVSCEQIKAACQEAGFVQGGANEGRGLWLDCIGPIMLARRLPTGHGSRFPHLAKPLSLQALENLLAAPESETGLGVGGESDGRS